MSTAELIVASLFTGTPAIAAAAWLFTARRHPGVEADIAKLLGTRR